MIAPKVPPEASESRIVIGRKRPEDREALEATVREGRAIWVDSHVRKEASPLYCSSFL